MSFLPEVLVFSGCALCLFSVNSVEEGLRVGQYID